MRQQKSLACSGARATTPCSFRVVGLHWKAAVEGDAAHLRIRETLLVGFAWTPVFFTNRAFHAVSVGIP